MCRLGSCTINIWLFWLSEPYWSLSTKWLRSKTDRMDQYRSIDRSIKIGRREPHSAAAHSYLCPRLNSCQFLVKFDLIDRCFGWPICVIWSMWSPSKGRRPARLISTSNLRSWAEMKSFGRFWSHFLHVEMKSMWFIWHFWSMAWWTYRLTYLQSRLLYDQYNIICRVGFCTINILSTSVASSILIVFSVCSQAEFRSYWCNLHFKKLNRGRNR